MLASESCVSSESEVGGTLSSLVVGLLPACIRVPPGTGAGVSPSLGASVMSVPVAGLGTCPVVGVQSCSEVGVEFVSVAGVGSPVGMGRTLVLSACPIPRSNLTSSRRLLYMGGNQCMEW